MPELDGKATHKDFITPFDAHDKALRETGDYKHQPFPKAIAHDPETGEPVIARDAKHEAELTKKKEK